MVTQRSDIHWRSIVLLTLIAGAIRFAWLDRPAIWGDEAATWRRVTGSYQQMVDELRSAGFQPAHYLITWWAKEGFPYEFKRQLESPDDAAEAARTRGFRDGGNPWGGGFGGPPGGRPGGPPGGPRRGGQPPPAPPPREVIVPTARLVDGGITPSPLVMRFVPALCGTLLVPAMYFLAGQLVARRTALLVAVFTCFSAYQLGYSRDAKMYAQLWCFATIHVACLLWWLKAYRREPRPRVLAPEYPKQAELGEGVAGVLPGQHVGHIARAFSSDSVLSATPAVRVEPPPTRLDTLVRWACWVTSGLAMIAFHAVGLGIVGIELLILLATAPQRIGLAGRSVAAIASPLLFVRDVVRDRRAQRNAARARLAPQDLESFLDADEARPYAVEPMRERRTTTLTAAAPTVESAGPSPGERFAARLRGFAIPPIVGFLLGAAAVVSLWWSYHDFTRFYARVTDTDSAVRFDVNDAGIDWVEPYNKGRTALGHFVENAGAYLMSWEWPTPETQQYVEPRTFELLSKTLIVLGVCAAVGLVPLRHLLARRWRRAPKPRKRWRGDEREPTLASISRQPIEPEDRERTLRGPMPATALLIVAAWLLVPAYGFYTASGAWKADGGRTRAASPTQAVVALFYPTAYNEDAKTLAGAVSVDAANADAAHEDWHGLRERLARRPWRELFVVHGLSEPRWPWLWPAVGVGLVVIAFGRRGTWRQRLGWAAAGGGAFVAVFALVMLAYVATPVQPRSVWMPRYLGFVWPAFAIALCVLLRRLPLAPIRWAAIGLLLVANVANFAARVRFGEPPTPRMGEDAARAATDEAARAYVLERINGWMIGGPGAGRPLTLPHEYYVANALKWDLTPREALNANGQLSPYMRRARDGNDVARQLRNDAKARDVTVWAELNRDAPAGDVGKELAAALGPTWQADGAAERWTSYDHWTWRRQFVLERHHFIRAAAPTTATAPAAAAPKPASPKPATVAAKPATRPTPPRGAPATRVTRAATTRATH